LGTIAGAALAFWSAPIWAFYGASLLGLPLLLTELRALSRQRADAEPASGELPESETKPGSQIVVGSQLAYSEMREMILKERTAEFEATHPRSSETRERWIFFFYCVGILAGVALCIPGWAWPIRVFGALLSTALLSPLIYGVLMDYRFVRIRLRRRLTLRVVPVDGQWVITGAREPAGRGGPEDTPVEGARPFAAREAAIDWATEYLRTHEGGRLIVEDDRG